jgi:hypothetical protein
LYTQKNGHNIKIVHSIEFIGGTSGFFCEFFLHHVHPKKEKKKEYFVTEARLVFLPEHLAEARTFFQFMQSKD